MPPAPRDPNEPPGAVMAAGVRLQRMRRRVGWARLAVWTAIAAGPVALALTALAAPATVQASTPAKATEVRTAPAAADPAGYAQLFASAWLRSSADAEDSAQSRLAQSLAPDVPLPDAAPGAHSEVESVVAVRSAQREGRAWSVTVAVQYADGRLRYFAVPVAADAAGASFTVTGAPGVVAGPGRAQAPDSPYTVSVPSDGDLTSTVEQFLTAYLAGDGAVDRYLAPGVQLPAVTPAPFQEVAVGQVLAAEEAAAAAQVPADGTTVRVLVQVEARDEAGRWPLGYELTLTARSGRWEISALAFDNAENKGGRS
ncbi:conjugal transfer protein [Streptomyces minutiscleroticus]|uniref:conjugal transfer protein n=1 Tax=Streptomyces minutiscleroticus TaxID=68238 RepID=UPI0033189E01